MKTNLITVKNLITKAISICTIKFPLQFLRNNSSAFQFYEGYRRFEVSDIANKTAINKNSFSQKLLKKYLKIKQSLYIYRKYINYELINC